MAGYGDDSGLSAWLAANGYSLPVGAPTPAVLRQRGSAYVDGGHEALFVGSKAGGYAQERSWPRVSAVLSSGETVPDDVIPDAVVHASYAAAFQEANEPGSLSAIGSIAGRVKREKVEGAVEVEYQATSSSDDLAASLAPVMTAVEGLLTPFLRAEVEGVGLGVWSVG